MAELLLADQFPLGESQGEAGKDEKGPGGAIEMVENSANRNLVAIAERGSWRQGAEHWWRRHHLLSKRLQSFRKPSISRETEW